MELPHNTALIIIDQQQGLDHPKLGQRNNPDAEVVMLQLLDAWRAACWPIIHIKHKSTEPDSVFWPLQSGFDFKNNFVPHDGELMMEKSIPCALLQTGLDKMLMQQKIDTLVLIGAATNNSIEATARTANGLGFKVIVIEDACFAFAKRDYFDAERTAEEVHAMSLANLQGEYAKVVSSHGLLQTLSTRSLYGV